ncbi:nucleoside triphosphate pyrophosphohydrolase family protein [Clostridium tepidum]|jgi:NTP pyrophosphatase (non-canonical NTP hydrolase)|uniref:Nucleotide pyrophosphohydrolase n=1 Tax=Clostridium tepidum TaxID=1962263 RepID=A0A1S9IBH6_9CLOT|nr:nucleoside triphosphate pyrophosphohydrolase family protein [Clostridium tepidum]MCR1933444.1 nucleoside triphosphate pyrophosphohydrolase family protein [Clostridium tepidum]MDU6878159.1 nucleoside triphosphate pyrophosphohydrolase family protein [Clostridium botulinum]OOO61712.1 nucleotide pyrophosphohydrolase [Clostridium tepidum]OOO67674.1 nucleotide pyrophosphohydrolase [Clostridium tepidum]
MDFREYEKEMKRTAGEFIKLDKKGLALGAMGISGEAGEVTDYIKKILFHEHELSKDKLIEELGDVLWYITYLSKVIGVDLETIANRNIEKLRKRYPEGWDPNRSIHREE